MRLPKPRPIAPAVPAAALANVALLLVFFFVLATRFTRGTPETVLPVAPGSYEASSTAVSLIVSREVGASGDESLRWRVEPSPGVSNEIPGVGSLYFEASRIVDQDPERVFLLRVDAGVRFAVVDDVLETLRRAGVRNVVFGARPSAAGGA